MRRSPYFFIFLFAVFFLSFAGTDPRRNCAKVPDDLKSNRNMLPNCESNPAQTQAGAPAVQVNPQAPGGNAAPNNPIPTGIPPFNRVPTDSASPPRANYTPPDSSWRPPSGKFVPTEQKAPRPKAEPSPGQNPPLNPYRPKEEKAPPPWYHPKYPGGPPNDSGDGHPKYPGGSSDDGNGHQKYPGGPPDPNQPTEIFVPDPDWNRPKPTPTHNLKEDSPFEKQPERPPKGKMSAKAGDSGKEPDKTGQIFVPDPDWNRPKTNGDDSKDKSEQDGKYFKSPKENSGHPDKNLTDSKQAPKPPVNDQFSRFDAVQKGQFGMSEPTVTGAMSGGFSARDFSFETVQNDAHAGDDH